MRLTCPNCGAEYEAPAEMIPGTGRHVQCSACHTRWFTRPMLSEDQILQRLENRSTARTAPDSVNISQYREDPGMPDEGEECAEDTGEATPEQSETDSEDFAWESAEPAAPVPSGNVTRLFPEPEAAELPPPPPAPEPRAEVAPTPEVWRTARRLEVPASPAQQPAPPRPRSGGFRSGLVVALVGAGLIFVAYWKSETILIAVPAAEPVVGFVTAAVDAFRDAVATKFPAEGG